MTDVNTVPRNNRNLLRMLPFILPYKKQVVLALVAILVASLATLAVPLAVRHIIDNGFSNSSSAVVGAYFAGMLGVVLVLALGSGARTYYVAWIGERIVTDVRNRLFNHLMTLSSEFYETQRLGDVMSRLNSDATSVKAAFSTAISIAARNIVTIVGAVVLMIISSPKLSGLAALAIPVIVLPLVTYGKRVRHLSRMLQETLAQAASFAQEHIAAVNTVQANVQEVRTGEEYIRCTSANFQAATSRTFARSVLTAAVIFVALGSVVGLLWMGHRSVLSGAMTAGTLGQFVLYAVLAASALGQLSEVWSEIQNAAGAAERIAEILAIQSPITFPNPPAVLPAKVQGALQFRDVTFFYPARPQAPTLHKVSLVAKPGEVTAIVGPSGAGKSTIFALVQRFYNVQQGLIDLDGTDIKTLDPKVLRAQIAVVPQETDIFSGSVFDNIQFSTPGASRAQVMAAAEAAHVTNFAERLPQGFDTQVGERGITLSGGQRQRIAIARAILRDAPILLLDEATSSLDAESEALVQEALKRLTQGRTTLVIAHRLATVRNAHAIVLMDGGTVMARGTHADLVKKNALYAKLAKLQFGSHSG